MATNTFKKTNKFDLNNLASPMIGPPKPVPFPKAGIPKLGASTFGSAQPVKTSWQTITDVPKLADWQTKANIKAPNIPSQQAQAPRPFSPLDSRVQSERDVYNQQVPMIDELYNLQKSESLQNIKALEEARKNTEKGYANNIKQVGEQYNIDATNTANEADKSIRQLAESKRLTDAGRQQTFANLNTIDSGGYNGFTGQQQNADSAFLGNQAELLQGKMQNLQQLKMMKQQKEQTALTALEQEEAAFNTQIRQINATMVAGSVESKQAKLEAFQGFQDRINGIKDSYYKAQQELDMSKAKLDAEIAGKKAAQDLKTGAKDSVIVPQITGLIDELLKSDTKPITGLMQLGGWIPGDNAQLAKAKFDQLKSLLSLDNIKYLKGTGAISDAEQRMLQQASTSLSRNLSDEDFQSELSKLKLALGGGQVQIDDTDELVSKYWQ